MIYRKICHYELHSCLLLHSSNSMTTHSISCISMFTFTWTASHSSGNWVFSSWSIILRDFGKERLWSSLTKLQWSHILMSETFVGAGLPGADRVLRQLLALLSRWAAPQEVLPPPCDFCTIWKERRHLIQKYGPFEKYICLSVVETPEILNQIMVSSTVLCVSLLPPSLFGKVLSQNAEPMHEACTVRTR